MSELLWHLGHTPHGVLVGIGIVQAGAGLLTYALADMFGGDQ